MSDENTVTPDMAMALGYLSRGTLERRYEELLAAYIATKAEFEYDTHGGSPQDRDIAVMRAYRTIDTINQPEYDDIYRIVERRVEASADAAEREVHDKYMAGVEAQARTRTRKINQLKKAGLNPAYFGLHE